MARPPAVNASPLIFLSKTGMVDYLQLAGSRIVVPEAVASEIQRFGPNDSAAKLLAETSWLEVMSTPPVPSSIQAWDLGPGESAVLAWCSAEPNTLGIIDDLSARHCATAFGIPVKGTLGLVLSAKQQGRIPEARPVLEELRSSGMYLSNRVLNRALKMVGE